jgi:MoaA/NifB/PqqE/SkfB family radical SAM enzyme
LFGALVISDVSDLKIWTKSIKPFFLEYVMAFKAVLKSGIKTLGSRTGRKSPVRVMYFSNFRCNLSCNYCGIWKTRRKEMTTWEVKRAMDEFSEAGTVMWTFTGGEPLLRQDIRELVDYASKKFLITTVTTNGILLKKMAKDLRSASYVTVSLDGGREINDANRGKGTFEKALEGIKTARKLGIKTVINAVVSKDNVKHDFKGIKELFRIAEETGSKLNFSVLYVDQFNTSDSMAKKLMEKCYLNEREKSGALDFIKEYKKKHRGIVMFSDECIEQLKDLRKWNKCYAGTLYCDLFPDGTVASCLFKEKQGINGLDYGFVRAFNDLEESKDCVCPSTCYNELNEIFSLKPRAVFENTMKYVRFVRR